MRTLSALRQACEHSVRTHSRTVSGSLARFCDGALGARPRLTAQFSFDQHVEHFFPAHGPAAWGSGFDAEAAVRTFQRAGGIQTAGTAR